MDGVRHKLVGVVANGVGLTQSASGARWQMRAALGIEPEEVVLVVVGRVTVEKGHLVLAEALRKSGWLANVRLLIVGHGPDYDMVAAAYRGVAGLKFEMLGQRPDVDLILAGSDVFVFPTLHENLSNALLEAMAAGLPVVASRVGGNVEVLEHGGGVLVPAFDSVQLSAALDRFIGSPQLRIEAGGIARRVVEERFSLESMIDGWESIYDAILGDTL